MSFIDTLGNVFQKGFEFARQTTKTGRKNSRRAGQMPKREGVLYE
jgi:hypothetical protein